MAASSVGRAAAALPRRRALPIAALVVAVLAAVLAAGVYLYDHSRREVIASGVRVDGVPIGGLHVAAARTKVERDLVARLNEPVTVTAAGRHWTLPGGAAHMRIDVPNMVAQALVVSREGSIFTRTARNLFGGSVNRNIALAVSYSHPVVRELTRRIAAALDRAPRNASVEPGPGGLVSVPSQVGLTVDGSRLGDRIDHALLGLAPSRTVGAPIHQTQPAITTANLAAKNPAYIVIDRAHFQLRFYDHLKLSRTYEIAVGMEGLETPAGLHHIEWEQVNPPWYVPKKAWAGALAGTVVPPGPGDPLKARFMSFEGGAGIHGIDPSEYSTIGHNASHGCVRMRIPDVIALYSVSPVGTPVYVI
jgi:lipoprotein-anchoring transpeptidase ErfK/SrfK